VILLDQAMKFYIKTNYYYGEERNILGHWFRLHFIENEGMAFGMKISETPIGKLILTLFRLGAVSFGFYLLKQLVNKGYTRGMIICGALILAGALGNLLDSMFYGMIFTESSYHMANVAHLGHGYGKFLYGRVVDMMYFPLFTLKFPDGLPLLGGKEFSFFDPVFNIADAAISVGVITLVLFQNKLLNKKETAAPAVAGKAS
jgi:signal peptidase II